MSATLRVIHGPGVGVELRRGRFDIMVDGKTVGAVANHESVDTPVEPGGHTIRMHKGRYSSHERSFEAAEGEALSFRCRGIRIWPMYLASIVMPSLAIALNRE